MWARSQRVGVGKDGGEAYKDDGGNAERRQHGINAKKYHTTPGHLAIVSNGARGGGGATTQACGQLLGGEGGQSRGWAKDGVRVMRGGEQQQPNGGTVQYLARPVVPPIVAGGPWARWEWYLMVRSSRWRRRLRNVRRPPAIARAVQIQ